MLLEATKEAETTRRNDSYKSLNPQEAKSKQNNNKILQKKKRKKKNRHIMSLWRCGAQIKNPFHFCLKLHLVSTLSARFYQLHGPES